ncbi:putative T7SS-secreted protein [Streptomyces sp. NPDC001339]|uniref:putative T7SS-secreted protein n=1 Tax=Streptomyces sp. NPDC001339 TaxID=3364563 RepID=UPI00369FEFED
MLSLGERIWGYGGGDPYEDNGQFSGLQFNPAPGVLQAIGDLVEDLNRAHKNITDAADTLRGINDGTSWTGKAAEGFREKTRPLPKMLDTAGKSFDQARKALDSWQSDLGTMQRKASSYESEAKTARKRAERAESNPDLTLFRDGGIGMTDAQQAVAAQRCESAVTELNAAHDQLSGIIKDAKNLRSQHEALSAKTASALSAAAEQAPDEPGFFTDLLQGFRDLARAIADFERGIGQWVKEHANAIAAIGDVFAAISTVTGMIGLLFPPAEGVMGTVSGVTSLAAWGLHATAQAAGGEGVVSDRTLTEDKLGAVSFGLGRIATGLEKVSKAVVVGDKINDLSKASGWASIGMTGWDWLKDQTALGYFIPDNKEEAAVVGSSMLLGGPMGPVVHLGMAFKHAWEKGSEKDAAAAQQAAG